MTIDQLENTRKRLIFRSWHRGTREMDLILGRFAETHVPEFSADELKEYDDLLKESDPDIYSWVTGRQIPPPEMRSGVLERLLAYRYA